MADGALVFLAKPLRPGDGCRQLFSFQHSEIGFHFDVRLAAAKLVVGCKGARAAAVPQTSQPGDCDANDI